MFRLGSLTHQIYPAGVLEYSFLKNMQKSERSPQIVLDLTLLSRLRILIKAETIGPKYKLRRQ